MKKRFLSILLSLCMVLALFPATAFAEDNEEPTETPVCTCEAACSAEAMNADCPVCGAEGATIENCGKYVAPVEETEPEQTAVEKVQALIDALPDADTITEENRADVEAQLTAIDEAKFPLSDELDALDFTKYNDAIAALNELDGMTGAEVPETLEDTLQGSGTEADPWILTQDSFTKAGTDESPVSAATYYYLLPSGSYKLGGDITLNKRIQIDAVVTLDLNGKHLTGCGAGDKAIGISYLRQTSGNLTLNDSSEAKTGAISDGYVYVDNLSSFTMNGGTIRDAEYGVYIYGGTFNMTGGSITGCDTSICNYSGTFNMTGGSITGCDTSICNYSGTVTLPSGTTLDGKVVTSGAFPFAGNTFEKDVQCGNKNWPIDGGTFLGVVKNGEYFGDQHRAGLITGGVFYEKVINYANGNHQREYASEIRGGVFYNKVENQRYNEYSCDVKAEITGGVFLGGITGDGTIEGTQHSITVDFGNGTTRNGIVVGDTLYPLGEPPVTRAGYKFVGWYKDAEFTEPWDFTNQNPVEDNMAFYAKWVCAGHTGGTATCQAQATCENCGEPYGERDSTNHVGTLGEWQKDANGHWKTYSCCSTVKGAEGAHNFGEDGKCECGAVQYTVTFDPNGGTVDPTSATTDIEGTLTELPTPTRSGSYRFDGWFTAKNGGTAVTVDTVFTAHTTAYAHWTYTGSTTPDYCVIKATAGEGGSITPSGRAAVLYGASKTFTITPDDGYAIADVKVDGKSVGAVKTYTFERVRGDHTIEAVFMKATGNPQTGVDVPFTDVSENDWFYEDVAYVYANELMKGTSETTFSPAVTTTRGMIVTILYRLEGEPTVSDTCPFEDVKSGSYYEKAITWAAANEIVSGYGNGKFGPDDAITREQMAVILYRYTQYKGMDVSVGEDTNILSYNDALDISEYAFSAMQWACGESILNGSDGNLMPQGNATRAQVAAILHRFCENILK